MMEKDLRVLYGVWPAAGAFATFALSNGVIQLYWLQDGGTRPTWLLGAAGAGKPKSSRPPKIEVATVSRLVDHAHPPVRK